MATTTPTLNTDEEVLSATRDLQRQTRDRLNGMLHQTNETRQVGIATLEELEQQRQQISEINNGTARMQDKLKDTERSMDRLDFWSFSRKNKKAAQALARKELEEKLDRHQSSPTTNDPNNNKKKETGAERRRRRKQNKDQPKQPQTTRTPLVPTNALDPNLDDAAKQQLREIEQDDQELDTLLEQLTSDVGNMQGLAKQMGQGVQEQEHELEQLERGFDKAQEKQLVVNKRFAKYLDNGKKWFQNNNNNKQEQTSNVPLTM